ncbi:FAD/NAD(P)-binding domain-containing protein [Gonapodya prolifera JEL478]|uniref:FAD/NAD(P)-binding domain-containing protein n=1 Tax=Gonapodya prolifera (strain JEL478) TaxID=1344416 RepID=A0A139A8U8_GONPJ|nr:FAD/NAD(P)-binding domain-containing protein [Gonapodya prolifera JEL478]|eukprot:KXS13109.1 FAD/NAD(P)-binding domain-containing protein [Gonapodya prolifera JEL478]
MTIDEFDVAIVGYGPTGAVLANLLGLTGIKVAVIERTRSIDPKPRVMRKGGDELAGGVYTGVDGEPILHFEVDPVSTKSTVRPRVAPRRCIIQTELEEDIRKGVKQFSNVKELLGYSVFGLGEEAEAVTLKLRVFNEETGTATDTAGEMSIRAKFVMGCDGGNSAIRKLINTKMNSLGFDEGRRHQALGPRSRIPLLQPEAPGLTFPCPRNIRRWEVKLLPNEDPADFSHPETGPERCMKLGEEFGTDLDSLKLWRAATYQLHCLVADKFSSKSMRVFIAGDAAHQMPPFMGQGLVSGVRDASFLAWRLAYHLKNEQLIPPTESKVLASYEVELKPYITSIVGMTKYLGNLIGEPDMEKATKRDLAMREAMKSQEKAVSREDRLPVLLGGIIGLGTPGAEKNFVQPFAFSADGRGRCWTTSSHMSIARAPLGGRNCGLDNSAFFDQMGGQKLVCLAKDAKDGFAGEVAGVRVVREEDTILTDWLKLHGNATVAVVRPDRSFCYGTASSAEGLNDLLVTSQKMIVV